MKKIFYLTLLSMIAYTASAQTIVVNYTPGTLGACHNRDTVSVTVTNSTLATVTNLRLEPTLNGFNFVSMVPVAGVSVTNPSNLTPQMTIASLAPAASVRIRYFVQSGCNSTSTNIANVLKTSGGAVINTANTGVINVLFPSITMAGISNTSAANQTSPGLLTNLVTEQVLVRGFTINSTNALVPLTQAKAVVLNQFRYYQFMGVNRGTFSQTSQGDTFTYTFRGSDFQTVGDGDTLLEVGENFTFYDTMRIKGCNTAVPSNLGLKYYATWGCFTTGAAFCDKSSDVNALGEARVVPYQLTTLSHYSGNGFSNVYGAGNRQSYCKPWEARTTYRNTTNNGGIPGAGTIYDLEFFQSSTIWPFAAGNLLQGFTRNSDGTTEYMVDSIKINGVLVSFKDTTSGAPGSIFSNNLSGYDSVIKINKLTSATYTSPTPSGLKDLDGDGQIDDLAEGDTVQIQVFYRMQGEKFTAAVNARAMEANDRAIIFDYQQTHTSVYFRNMCKESVLPRTQFNFHYNYQDLDQFEVGGTEDFYGGGAQHAMYVKFWNQYSLPHSYVDTQKIIVRTILPPGLNYVPGSVGRMVQQVPSISQISAPGTHWLNAAQQYEVDGPGDYDTVVFVWNNSSLGNNQLGEIPFRVTLDCASLADPCADVFPSVALVQDSIRSFFFMQWISDGSVCYNELLMKDGSPIRKHCPANKKGYNLTAFDVKRETIGFLPDYRRVKITPSHPFIDSIDYSQTIPYDTVKYTIRGYVKDTAFNSGIAYAHFKNLYDNLDTIRVLPTSTIRIFDVSSSTTYNFFVTNARYVRPATGRGDIEINLGAFVDSVRASGNTTFMMGGSTGSSVYTPDSFVIEFYGVLTHNSQREPYLNTQRDISPIGELKSEVAQVNQDCELWGRRLAVFQLYWVGQQIFDYVPQASTVGACDMNGNHMMRIYYWNLPSPDYFPFETRFSNRIPDTWSITYNPVFIDSIFGPQINSFLSFNRNPAGRPNFTDSNNFSRNVSFGNQHLPQNQRLIERYLNRIVWRLDSVYPKIAPTFTSDDYHHFDFGFFFRPTCALPLSIPYASHNNSAGSFMPNLFRGRFIYWHNRQMPRIFDSVRFNGGTGGGWTSYSAAATNPNHSLTVNPSSANIAQKDTLEWTVTVGNTSTTAMPRTWLDFRAKSATIVRVVDIATNTDMPLLTYAVGANQYKWSQVGNVPASGSRQFRVFAKVNGCENDTIVLREGFNCSYYPTDPDAGYLPPNNYKCPHRENVAFLPIQIPPGQIQVVMTSITPGTGVINVCDTITVEYRITNLGAADLRKVNFAYTIPVSSNLTYVPNSANYKWPATASYQVLPVVPTINGGTYNFDMTGYFKNGVLPNQTATGDSNSVVVRMRYATGCPFRSGDQIFMNTTGERACGDVIQGNGFATLQLRVNGLPTNPSLTMEVNPFTVSDFGMCADTGRIEMLVRHTSGSTTNGSQYIQYEMPQNFVLTPGTVTVTNPSKFTSTTPTVTTTGGKTILEWRFASNFAVNDTARIRFGITSTSQRLTCANNLYTKTTVLEKYPVSAACASGGNCNVDFPIFTKEDTSAIQGGIISITNLAVTSSLINSPLGETVNYSYTVTNTGKAASNLRFKFMGGAFMTDSVFTHTVASLASGASTNVTGSYFAPAGKACALRVMLDSSVNCVCSYPSASVGFGVTAAKNDTTVCSGTTLSVGMNPVSGYTYLWGDGNTTSNPSYTYTNTDPNNMDTVRNTLFITRMGCNSFDTIVVAIKPIPQGLAITPDNTCLLTNPITFTASSTSSGVTYAWTFPGGGSSTTNPTDRTMLAGTQNVIINATKNGCATTYNESFVFYDLNNAATADNPVVCFNSSTLLRANSSNATNFQWYR
ncbi:MAG: hypothetical protein JNL75_00510, partial [Chitinophagales bacterium]|nr:hypothetical protein [Chitinophagales bacterium]